MALLTNRLRSAATIWLKSGGPLQRSGRDEHPTTATNVRLRHLMRHLRQIARAIYWIISPHKNPTRIAFIQALISKNEQLMVRDAERVAKIEQLSALSAERAAKIEQMERLYVERTDDESNMLDQIPPLARPDLYGGALGKYASPSLENPVSQACTQAQFDAPIYRYWCGEIRETPRYHRKQWEFCYILQALTTHGAMREGYRGLGFGVGTEPLTAVLAARGCRIVATDLDPDEARGRGWVDTNQHAAHIAALNKRGICDPERFATNVMFRIVNMNQIPADLKDFDFTWSACCLEHLGSISNGLAFIENSLWTLRPGGIAVHTTEFNCFSNDDTLDSGGTVLFRRRDIEALSAHLRAHGHDVTLNFHIGNQGLDQYVDVPPYSADKHLKVRIAQYTTTSFGIIVRRALGGKSIEDR